MKLIRSQLMTPEDFPYVLPIVDVPMICAGPVLTWPRVIDMSSERLGRKDRTPFEKTQYDI